MLTDQQERWTKARIAAGDFTNASNHIRELIRRNQEDDVKLQALRTATQKGWAVA